MGIQDQVRDYLEEARQAEHFADLAKDSFQRDGWLMIASSYRELAAFKAQHHPLVLGAGFAGRA